MPAAALVRYLVVLAVALVAAGVGTALVHRFGSRWLELSPRASRALAVALASWVAALAVGRLGGRWLGDPMFAALAIAGTLGLVATLAAAALFAFVAVARKARGRRAMPDASEGAAGRRAFIARAVTGVAVTSATTLGAHGVFGVRRAWSLEEIVIPIEGLPRALDGYAIAQISDLHIGLFADERMSRAAETLIARAQADAIVITGDLVDNHPRDIEPAARLVRRLVALGARDGVFAIAGNHEHYVGAADVLAALRRAGAATLRNESAAIGDGRIALLGVDDAIAGLVGYPASPDLARAIASAPPDAPRILLAHDPGFFVDAAPHVQLQLSGHTHGGQVAFAGVRPAALLMRHGYVAGVYERDRAHLHVSRGFGTTGPPLRLEVTPEVTRIVLVAA